ncbi:MAG: tetratricopeptide repeat protein [Acidobacteriota bacterium]
MRTLGPVIAAMVIVSGTPWTAGAQNRREMQMMADLRILQEQSQQLQLTLAQLGEALKALNTRLDDQAATNRKAFADQNLKIDQFTSDLRVVREGVSESNVRISSISHEIEALRLSIPQYPPPAPAVPAAGTTDPSVASGTPDGVSPVPAPGPAPAPPPPVVGPGMSPQRLYDTAWADYTAGQWDLCLSGFETYLRTFPKSDLADEAQFYIGECRYADGKHKEAVAAYTEVITGYPRGQSVPPAYYKRGLAYERLGQIDRARESFEQLVKEFPESDAARLAKQSLDRLNRARPPRR